MPSGGKRKYAGRPKGTGKYKEMTTTMRVPMSFVGSIQKLINSQARILPPLFTSKIQAGFPSPADDYQESNLDLNEHLIKHPASTFFVRVMGDSMIGAGMFANDILIVDKSLPAKSGKIIVAVVNGEFTVKRLVKKRGKTFLVPENDKYEPLDVTDNENFQVWGVVTKVIQDV